MSNTTRLLSIGTPGGGGVLGGGGPIRPAKTDCPVRTKMNKIIYGGILIVCKSK